MTFENEIREFLGTVNDPRFNSIRLNISTEAVFPVGLKAINQQESTTGDVPDAELGRDAE